MKLLGAIKAGDQPKILEMLDRDPGAVNQVSAFEEYEDSSTTREQWLAELAELGCDDVFPSVVVGECSNNSAIFLSRSDGVTSLTHYFSPDTEGFISLTSVSDSINLSCLGVGYWPEHLECNDAVITEVLCGTQLEVGDTFDLP